ncbi:hypothetical protein IQ268_30675 [Oculatella sp. LEGE 06141]|nr:hypothetical protein [Oculatella sp. LEGE 06141]MBE9182904.1 hypothetical protein [Oculatella sp. LEGE 06141]
MQKRPSNTLLYVVLSIVFILSIYIVGSLVLEARQDVPDGTEDVLE